jgi:hypothetical protein
MLMRASGPLAKLGCRSAFDDVVDLDDFRLAGVDADLSEDGQPSEQRGQSG